MTRRARWLVAAASALSALLALALTGFTPLLELEVIEPQSVLAAVDQHLDRLFAGGS